MTTPFCAAMAAAFCGAMRLPVSVPSESRIRTRDSTSRGLERADGEPDRVAEHGVLAGHAGRERVEQRARRLGVAGEGHQHVGRVAEDDEPDAVVAAVGDEAVEHRLDAVEPRAARAVGAGEVAGRHRARDVDGEHDVAGGLGALDRIADPFRAGEREDDERPGEPGEGHLPAGNAAGPRRLRPCRARRWRSRRTAAAPPAPPRAGPGRARAPGAEAAARGAPRGRPGQA